MFVKLTNDMFPIEPVPQPTEAGWTKGFLHSLTLYVDREIENPTWHTEAERKGWDRLTDDQQTLSLALARPYREWVEQAYQTHLAEKTPEAYVQWGIMARRLRWLERWINDWVYYQRTERV